jgi:hypothetical protein
MGVVRCRSCPLCLANFKAFGVANFEITGLRHAHDALGCGNGVWTAAAPHWIAAAQRHVARAWSMSFQLPTPIANNLVGVVRVALLHHAPLGKHLQHDSGGAHAPQSR